MEVQGDRKVEKLETDKSLLEVEMRCLSLRKSK